MKDLINSAKFLLADLAATLLFFLLYSLTHNIWLAVIAGATLAVGQIAREYWHGRAPDTLQWVSLVVVIASGSATLLTSNPVFVMVKPSLIYLMVGWAMLQRGWMNRYLPARALEYLPDLGVLFGYAWAGLMFVSAAVNLVLALSLNVASWGVAIGIWGTASKIALFLIQFAVMKNIGRRRRRARLAMA